MSVTALITSPVDLNGPGGYVHWSVFTVSVANLVLILVMVVIFGVALLVPFPHGRSGAIDRTSPPPVKRIEPPPTPEDGAMWTARLRRAALRVLPPEKLLPDRQPAYVASWIYVFGVGALAALGVAVVSGFTIAIGGTDWWHTTTVGHFCNSLHLWSVELFMALMVIHLWGKFWMAAWRGRRAATWITGVIAFLASVVECFTGYLSQSNFDSQWISTNGKDAFNAIGMGAFFNLMNVGQMLLWHVVLIPIILIALVGAHVLLVRARGVSHPLPEHRVADKAARQSAREADALDWTGPTRRYDIIKEGSAAVAVVVVLVVVLAGFLSSPDVPPVTVQTWATVAPADFVATTASELAGTSETANYGPPYNNGTGSTQSLLFAPAKISGVRQPIDTANTYVLSPLSKLAATDPKLAAALAEYDAASADQQQKWNTDFANDVAKVTINADTVVMPPKGDYGPLPTMFGAELALARSGGLDADLLAQRPFYGTNFTKPLLFLEDGSYYGQVAQAQHLTGSQWGVMNETGSYPGQPWLWLYTLWYQVRPFKNSTNVDLMAVYLTGAATVILLALPFIPGLRDIPTRVPLYRLVWRDWYHRPSGPGGTGTGTEGGPQLRRPERVTAPPVGTNPPD